MSVVSKTFQRAHREKVSKGWFSDIIDKIDNAFKGLIPESVLELPRQAMYGVGVSSYAVCLAIFVLIVFTTYHDNITQVYISPVFTKGLCQEVLSPFSGTYLADLSGNWESSVEFQPTQAVYVFKSQSLNVSQFNYSLMLTALNGSINYEAGLMPNNTLTSNLVIWTSWVADYVSSGNIQFFSLDGAPAVIFNRDYLLGTISNVYADCNASSVTTFSKADYMLTMEYDFSDFQDNPTCNSVINPSQLGYSSLYSSDTISMSIDVRSFLTAVAVNEGVMLLTSLEKLTNSTFPFVQDGVRYNVSNYYDARYPGMNPIYCAINLDTEFIVLDAQDYPLVLYNTSCGLEFPNQTYSVPIFNHFGYSQDYPSYCACQDGLGPGATEDACSGFDLMAGVILYDNTQDADFADGNPFIDLANKVPINLMNPAAYDAMYMAVSSHYTDQYEDLDARLQAYEFCNVSYGSCTLVTISLFDDANTAVTDYYHQLLRGSCSDSISIPPAAYQKLVDTPPASLTMPYYNCRQSPTSVLSAAVGIGSGNMGAVIPVVFLCIINLYYLVKSSAGKKKDKRTYDRSERDDALQGLAVQLLMTRDNRYPATRKPRRSAAATATGHGVHMVNRESNMSVLSTQSGESSCLPPNVSVLRMLTEELMENAYISTYFDDESEGEGSAACPSTEVGNPMVGDADVELGAIGSGKVVTVLNEAGDDTADTVVAFTNTQNVTEGEVSQGAALLPLLDSLVLRMVGTTKEGEENDDFWSLVLHTSVLHHLDLDTLRSAALRSPDDQNYAFAVYVKVVMKIYEMINWHIR